AEGAEDADLPAGRGSSQATGCDGSARDEEAALNSLDLSDAEPFLCRLTSRCRASRSCPRGLHRRRARPPPTPPPKRRVRRQSRRSNTDNSTPLAQRLREVVEPRAVVPEDYIGGGHAPLRHLRRRVGCAGKAGARTRTIRRHLLSAYARL